MADKSLTAPPGFYRVRRGEMVWQGPVVPQMRQRLQDMDRELAFLEQIEAEYNEAVQVAREAEQAAHEDAIDRSRLEADAKRAAERKAEFDALPAAQQAYRRAIDYHRNTIGMDDVEACEAARKAVEAFG